MVSARSLPHSHTAWVGAGVVRLPEHPGGGCCKGRLCYTSSQPSQPTQANEEIMLVWKIHPVVSDHRVTLVRWKSRGCLPAQALGSFCVWSSAHLHRAIKLCLSSLPWTFQASLIRFALYVAIKAKHLQSFQFCRIISEATAPNKSFSVVE